MAAKPEIAALDFAYFQTQKWKSFKLGQIYVDSADPFCQFWRRNEVSGSE